MNILRDLKARSLAERKAKGPLVKFYSFIVSEIANVGLNDGKRETTDDEAIRVIKKSIAAIEQSITDENFREQQAEIDAISGYIPSVLSEDETRAIIEGYGLDQIGPIMGRLKKEYGARVDMKIASKIAKEFT